MTPTEKAEAVVDGLTGLITVERWRAWPFRPLRVSLDKDHVDGILEVVSEKIHGRNGKLIGLSHRYCCKTPRVIVHTYNMPTHHAFTGTRRASVEVCSVCGDVWCKKHRLRDWWREL